MLKEKVVVGLLIASMHWHSSCMKIQDIAGTYRSMGKGSLHMEICKDNILQVQGKAKEKEDKNKEEWA